MSKSSKEKQPKRKALGKGLGALIPAGSGTRRAYMMCSVSQISPAANQPRKSFDDAGLEDLARSIEASGLIQPLVVRSVEPDRFELIAGERRWRACKLAGVDEVPVVVKDVDDEEAFVLALVENIQREDLNPVEEATAYQRLLDRPGSTQQKVATEVGKSRSAVANSLRLLNLPDQVQSLVAQGSLSAGHARSLVTLPTEESIELADIMVKHNYSVREAEELVRESRLADQEEEPAPQEKPERKSRYRDDAQVREVAERLQEALGTKVVVKDRRGSGRIEIHYSDYDVLQDVLERIFEG